jgi:hypothetical protein
MRYLLTILAALFLCSAPTQAQTLKSLMFNSTNGQVVYAGTNALTFTNALSFGTNAAVTRTNLLLGATWLTNTNVTNFRTAIGLGATNAVTFEKLYLKEGDITLYNSAEDDGFSFFLQRGTNADVYLFNLGFTDNSVFMGVPIAFNTLTDRDITRTNLSLGLPALTNTSNVTMMRALAGSTNTNQPFSGTLVFTDPIESDVNVLTVSNGIIVKRELQ